MSARHKGGGGKVLPKQNPLATTPFFEHLDEEFGRAVLSAQTCGSYEPASPNERWFCARVHHNMEYVALVDIVRFGFPAHLSLFVEPTKRNPSRPSGIRRGTPVIRRCFPGFVFVALDFGSAGWGKVKEARGFNALLTRAGGVPQPVPRFAMFELLSRAGTNGYQDDITPGLLAAQAKAESQRALRKSPWTNMTALSDGEREALLMRVMTERSGKAEAA